MAESQVQMAWCMLRAGKLTLMLAGGGVRPMVAFRTLDLSPKAGYEWLMHGATTIRSRLSDQSEQSISSHRHHRHHPVEHSKQY